METLTMMFGIGVIALLLLVFALSLDREHTYWKLITAFFFFGLITLMAKVALDNNDFCSTEIANATLTEDNFTTVYDYEEVCITNTSNNAATLYKGLMTLLVTFSLYILVYVMYILFYKKKLFIANLKRGKI